MPSPTTDLLKGTLDLMILKSLSWGPAHGYGIARWIERRTDDALAVSEGALYPALRRLEAQKCIAADWAVTEHNREAKVYRLTAAGRAQLRTSQTQWTRFARALTRILQSSPRTA